MPSRALLRMLRRQYELDDEALDELVEELVDVQRVARREENVLVWAAETTPSGAIPGSRFQAPGARSEVPVRAADTAGAASLRRTRRGKRRHAGVGPGREVGDQHVIALVTLRFVEQPPTTRGIRAAGGSVETAKEIGTDGRGGAGMRRRGTEDSFGAERPWRVEALRAALLEALPGDIDLPLHGGLGLSKCTGPWDRQGCQRK